MNDLNHACKFSQRDRGVFNYIYYTYFLIVLSINMTVILVLSVVLGHVQQRESPQPLFLICVIEMENSGKFSWTPILRNMSQI